ncbi:MAG: hypothetical protein K0R68_2262 [Mycobacterium sp.]|jgi:drug/metabolite transporter (DMT)-like permease|nr:hypothetical protein [Mycobacterium sp.]
MRSALLVLFGVIIALFGALFTLQGIGVVQGSPMSNTTTWTVLGPLIVLGGAAMIVLGRRLRR